MRGVASASLYRCGWRDRRWLGIVLGSWPAAALFATPAVADCDIQNPATGQTTTCSPAAPNPNTTGVQAVAGSMNVTVNVQSGAGISVVRSVTANGIAIDTASQVTNNGAVSLTGAGSTGSNRGAGILASGNNNTMVSNGTIATTGSFNDAMTANGSGNTLTNNGTITTSGQSAHGISVSGDNTIANSGSITTGGTTARGVSVSGSNVVITNSGSITTNGTNATAVFAQGTNNRLTNSGTIHVTGTGADAVFMNTVGTSFTATIENSAGGKIISDQGEALRTLTGTTTVINAGLIQSPTIAFDGGNAQAGSSLTFILQTGSQIIGAANGASNASSALQLQGTGVVDNAFANFQTLVMNGTDWTWQGTGDFTSTSVNSGTLRLKTPLTGDVTVAAPGTLEASSQTLTGNVANDGLVRFAQSVNGTYAGVISGTGAVAKTGAGTLTLTGNNTYAGGTTVSEGTLQLSGAGTLGSAVGTTTVSGGTLDLGGTSQTQNGGVTLTSGTIQNGTLSSSGSFTVQSGAVSASLAGSGNLVKTGSGTVILTGTNGYTGGTTVSGGTLIGNTASLQGNIVNDGAVVFYQTGSGVYAGNMSGSGSLALDGGGMLTLSGVNTYTGPTTINSGTLAVTGSLASDVTVNGGTVGGNGTFGGLVVNGGIIAPGNSIGTLGVSRNFTQNGGIYRAEVNAAGQSDLVSVGGTATITGGAIVQVLAQSGTYAPRTTYTILRATGGVSGTYAGVTSNFAFLTPSLSYDANDVFLTLQLAGFASGARTPNQVSTAAPLDQSVPVASGDFATVLSSLISLDNQRGPRLLDMISGQQYAGFQNAMVQGAQLFMSNFANRAGSRSTAGARIALAEACDVACDATTPAVWGAWGGAVGGTGTIAGNDNAGTFTYSVGGFSGGLDRKFGDNFLAGVTVGYQTGGQWTGGFDGRSVTDTIQAGLYASFVQGPLYVDALAGYAYNANQMWRNINIPSLQPRTAYGQTAANQFLGQIEAGYRVDLGGTPEYFVTPFALVQGSTANQNAFTETGARSLSLNVAQQTSGSLRSIIGAQLGASMDVGLRDKIAAQLRFGWSHEYADTARPVSATFVGAPSLPFTVQGAAPTRDGAVIGFSASTAIAEAMGVYVRYEGTISGQDSSHALTAGLRVTW
jgi:autotransporter-associated beta strand protein